MQCVLSVTFVSIHAPTRGATSIIFRGRFLFNHPLREATLGINAVGVNQFQSAPYARATGGKELW